MYTYNIIYTNRKRYITGFEYSSKLMMRNTLDVFRDLIPSPGVEVSRSFITLLTRRVTTEFGTDHGRGSSKSRSVRRPRMEIYLNTYFLVRTSAVYWPVNESDSRWTWTKTNKCVAVNENSMFNFISVMCAIIITVIKKRINTTYGRRQWMDVVYSVSHLVPYQSFVVKRTNGDRVLTVK